MAENTPVALNQLEIDTLAAAVEQLDGISTKKLADKLGCTVNAASKRWHRIKEKLGQKDGDEESK